MTKTINQASTSLFINDQAISHEDILDAIRSKGWIPDLVNELLLDKALAKVLISPEEEEEELQAFRSQLQLESEEAFMDYLHKHHFNERLMRKKLTRATRIVRYREERWGPRVESLYLKHKERYDLVTYYCLQCGNADVMLEVFFRLKDREESWESLAKQFAGGDVSATSRKGPVPVSDLEAPVLSALRQQGPGRVCKPIHLQDQVLVVELETFQPSEFNEELRKKILREEFNNWMKDECNRMLNKVIFQA